MNTGNHIFFYETPFLDLETTLPPGDPASGSPLVSFSNSCQGAVCVILKFHADLALLRAGYLPNTAAQRPIDPLYKAMAFTHMEQGLLPSELGLD